MIKNVISIKNLSKTFESVKALEDVSLEVPSATIFGFLGPNGAGKTTTIRMLLGILEPSKGGIEVLGYSTITQADQIRSVTGALLEHSGIYEQMTAFDNLEFYGRVFNMPLPERHARIEELLIRMGLWERRNDRAGSWSRGMKQKLALARTLLHRPRLVLLDEPTAGLDVASAVAIREDLDRLVHEEDVTIFLTSHNMADVEKLCDQVAIINKGKLIVSGSPEALRREMCQHQLEILGHNFDEGILRKIKAHSNVQSLSRKNGSIFINLHQDMGYSSLVTILVEGGAQIDEVRRNKISMEEVFLALTAGGKDEA